MSAQVPSGLSKLGTRQSEPEANNNLDHFVDLVADRVVAKLSDPREHD